MGRELRRKEERKNKNRVANRSDKLDTSIKGSTVVKITLFILVLLLVLWYVIAAFVTKEVDISKDNNTNSDVTDTSSTVSNKILASKTFDQKEELYYVYYYDFNDEDNGVATAINSKSELKIYRVDTNNSLNKNYVTEDAGNALATGIENLKVKNPTLIEITNDKITGYYEGNNNIISFLGK